MDVSQVSMTSSMAAIVRELQTISEMQTAIMKSIADILKDTLWDRRLSPSRLLPLPWPGIPSR